MDEMTFEKAYVKPRGSWTRVRDRIEEIASRMDAIESRLDHEGENAETVQRLERLQEKFEVVMRQLAAFDDEGEAQIRRAKEEFRRILRRHRLEADIA